MRVANSNLRGALFMMVSMAAFTFNDASMKALSDELPLFQAIFLRGIATCVLMFIVAFFTGGLRVVLPRRDRGLIALRSVCDLVATVLFLTALFKMPLANVTAILQALPLTVTLAGALFLGEQIGWRRMLAIFVGFIGVILIIQPGASGFSTYSMYVLAAVGFITIRDLAARRLSPETPSITVALIGALLVTIAAGLATFSQDWAPVSPLVLGQLGAASFFIIVAYLFSVMTMRTGDIIVVSPFRYTSLLWALLLGFAVFGEWPDGLTMVGAAIVVITGVFTLLRERRLAAMQAAKS